MRYKPVDKLTFETDRECAIRSYRVYGKAINARLYEDDTKNRYFHLYFNPSRQAAEREQLERMLDRMKTFLDKHTGQAVTFGNAYHEYFDLQYDKKGVLTGYAERKDVIRQKLELCGYFCIITSDKMTATDALIQYKGRDVSEKLFSADKSFIGSKSMRVQTEETLSAKLFIEPFFGRWCDQGRILSFIGKEKSKNQERVMKYGHRRGDIKRQSSTGRYC